MIPKPYNFPKQYAGTTFNPIQITFKEDDNITPIDITGWIFKMQFRTGEKGTIVLDLTNDNGINIINAAGGVISIGEFINPTQENTYLYDLFRLKSNGNRVVYIEGQIFIKRRITEYP